MNGKINRKQICPIMSRLLQYDSNEGEVLCLEERCAWWANACAVSAIAFELVIARTRSKEKYTDAVKASFNLGREQ